ncbi:MAG TPA: hypothetical protein VK887_00550 [Pseudonocardiaceae bacterium]|nr:hypothetical protein [Pseudonocardiaceae bacterium]
MIRSQVTGPVMVPTAAGPPDRLADGTAAPAGDCRRGRTGPPRGLVVGEGVAGAPVLVAVLAVVGPRMSCLPVVAAVGLRCGVAAAPQVGHEESVVPSGVAQPVQ